MSTVKVGISGAPPEVVITPANPEAEKYGRMWADPEYRKIAPGEEHAMLFLGQARPHPGAEVIDFGCGTGRGALQLALFGKMKVTMLDFVRNCLDPEIAEACVTQPEALRFLKADLEQPIPVTAQYGYCTDVLEHIPPDKVDRVLDHILKAAQHVFFTISTEADQCGQLIGEELHLTIQPASWWQQKFTDRGCIIHWAHEQADVCAFYVSAWAAGPDIVKTGVLNISLEQVRANVTANIAGDWQQIQPHEISPVELVVLGGGPSLDRYEKEIKQHVADGCKVATLNGAYGWAHQHGIWPVNQVIVDARDFNTRFVEPVDPACKYFMASQVDPGLLAKLPKDRTRLFHTMTGSIDDLLDAQYGAGGWYPVPGGSTVLLRAIPLFRMLGFTRFHLYGCDSCLLDGQHHAFAQPENDGQAVFPVTTNPGGKIFTCTGWMNAQAQEFIDLIRVLGDEIELDVPGEGLLAYILETAAAIVEPGSPTEET